MKKRLFCMLLVIVLISSMIPPAFSADNAAVDAANALHDLGLFQGVGNNADGTPNFDLDRAPNRHEAVTMLVRLLGKEEEALAGTWDIPFTDVAEWAKPYVGYAYANDLTKGISETEFGGQRTVTASQYITFVLRALGYISEFDFEWNKAWELSDKLGITNGDYNIYTNNSFTRGDTAIISNNALYAAIKNTSTTLFESLNFSTSASVPSTPEVINVATPNFYEGTVVGKTVHLGWGFTDPTVSGFEIYRSEYEEGEYELLANIKNPAARNYSFTGEAGKCYYFKMRAYYIGKSETFYSSFQRLYANISIPSDTGLVIEMPNLPTTVSWYMYDGNVYSSAKITNITYKVRDWTGGIMIDFYFDGVKIANGPGNNYAVYFEYVLIDKETGMVVNDGSFYQDGLQVGQTFTYRLATQTSYEGFAKKTYILKIMDA